MKRLALAGLIALLIAGRAAAEERPKFAVVILVDQLSMAQLDRYEDLFGEGGFRRLLSEGSVARDAQYMGAPTVTAHGHATLATGAYGDHHGVVGNEWWEHDALVHVAHDDRYRLLTRETDENDATAPTVLRAPTFADALRWTWPKAKVVSVSLKDRGAILFAGAKPTAAIWYDSVSDRWTTSSYYGDKLPAWVPLGEVSGTRTKWERFGDGAVYSARAAQQDAGKFGHDLPAPGQPRRGVSFMNSPLADEALFDLATRALDAEKLGSGSQPDLLFISASAFDLVGHAYGPESEESLDSLLRLDAQLARLFKHLDDQVGPGKYVVALTADHGIQPAPKRVIPDGEDAGTLDTAGMARAAEAALTQAFGPGRYLSPFVGAGGFSFRASALAAIDRPKADQIVIDALRTFHGVADVYPRSLFVSHLALRGDATFYARSYYDGRSPDFIVLPKPLWILGGTASHGTPYRADTRVPLIFYRAGKQRITIDGSIDVASLTPTIALILHSAVPDAAEAPILTQVVDALR